MLLEEDEIWINHDDYHEEPGLLRTCSQIRAEASAMFFTRNSFSVTIECYSLVPQKSHWYWKKTPYENTQVELDGSWVQWDSLLEWLEIHHAGFDPKFFRAYKELAETEWDVLSWINKFFDMAKTLRSQPWEAAKGLLEHARQLVKDVIPAFKDAKSRFLNKAKSLPGSDSWAEIEDQLDHARQRVEDAITADDLISTFCDKITSLCGQYSEEVQVLLDQAHELVKDAIQAHDEFGHCTLEQLEKRNE